MRGRIRDLQGISRARIGVNSLVLVLLFPPFPSGPGLGPWGRLSLALPEGTPCGYKMQARLSPASRALSA
jgi:hypothetical protein